MIEDILNNWLPYTFAFLMGASMLIYAVLDGYDLGVGILSQQASPREKDKMIASIGPFWDANETWLVLGVGILLIAFPAAHGVVLTNLYLPVALMLVGLIFRGVAFDFRAKAKKQQLKQWNLAFFLGSFLTAFSQGYMLGSYILGFQQDWLGVFFSILVGFCVCAGYCLVGACWLILKTEGALQKKAVLWARIALYITIVGIGLVSLATPLASARIFDKWFSMPNFLYMSPIPFLTAGLVIGLEFLLRKMPQETPRFEALPFFMTIGIFVLCFLGLAFSFFPYIVPEQMLITQAAAYEGSLIFILIGVAIVFPILLGYTFFAYKVFSGKAQDLRYD